MNEQEVKAIEIAISRIADTITNMQQDVSNLEMMMSNLNDTRRMLIQQLPHDKRIEYVFK